AATGLTADEVADCLAAIRLTRMVSYPAELELGATRLDDRQDRPDAAMQEAEMRQLLADAIEALPARERLVVTLYYGEARRLKETSRVLGLSESRASRILNAALFDLGEYMRGRT